MKRGRRRSSALGTINEHPNSPSKSSTLEPKIGEEDDDDALQMFEKIRALKDKENAGGQEIFGFRTPTKKSQMAEKVAQELLSRKTTPVSSPYKTPTKLIKSGTKEKKPSSMDTPLAFRRHVSKRLAQRPSDDEEESSSASESSEEEDLKSEDEDTFQSTVRTPTRIGTPSLTPRRRGPRSSSKVTETQHDVEHYFEAQNGPDKTSDRTLSRLKTPRLSQDALRTILSQQESIYSKEIEELSTFYRTRFEKWMLILSEDFNIVTFGLGSKRSILLEFQEECIAPHHDCVVVNGFFPSLTIKQVLNNITCDIMEHSGSLVSVPEQCEFIINNLKEPLYLIIHNIDGPNLRGDKVQSVLAQLGAHPHIHIICSIDHINAPLIWDQKKLSKFNFIWYDTTTFLSYTQETLNENSLMVQQTNALALSSLAAQMINLRQKISESGANYSGISFPNLYQRCREAFLVNSDITLRAQLTEFKDHKLIRIKKGFDGMDHLTIPLNNSTLRDFVDEQKELLN
ncbi:ORC2 [Lepeophtheirus salmonis]|uniref:Origin recognition complex subunit 2 n=1 Tax=Lepeophtheirus salmonis TaxID=72036 RepID=A0A7R8H2F7_LEPSM|nr:ORC2 [Lepeophtheirus salmonis]CAF2813091.1 ORC2 [Lepeophtheirus salmonis]